MTDTTRIDVPLWGALALALGGVGAVAITFLARALPKETRRWPRPIFVGLLTTIPTGLASAVFFLLVRIETIESQHARHEQMRAMGIVPHPKPPAHAK